MHDFNYIIVGGGSAGCVLANRLSADPDQSVCLLEAGRQDSSFLIRLPAGILALMWDPRHNWKYYSEPEPQMNNRRMYCPRGKVLGGSSSINAMCFTRGTPEDFNSWNIEGWAWDDLLPHFIHTQGQTREGMDQSLHGYDGEQLIADVDKSADPLSLDFIKAVAESGLAPENDDFNGKQQEGAGLYQTFQNGRGKRYSAADAFLHSVSDRPNLTVISNALVEKVIFENKTAIGVQCIINDKQSRITASSEVILSAGAINSPQLLLLSGIGPAEELTKHKITPVHNLAGVGKNLHDHLDIIINTRIRGFKGLGISLPYFFKGIVQAIKYFNSGRGHLSSNGAEAGGFVKSDPALQNPDLQMHFAPLLLDNHLIRTIGHGHCLHVCNLQPKSRGAVTLKTANPADPPAIQFNYCKHPDDLDKMVKAVKIGRKVVDSPSLKRHTTREHTPGDDVQTDDEIRSFIREKAQTIYHPVGTCKMGTDELSVVDENLRVYGTTNLRVVDASVMPKINSGNTHATVIAIADKASELISSACHSKRPQ